MAAMWPPLRVKTTLTPSFFNTLATSQPPCIMLMVNSNLPGWGLPGTRKGYHYIASSSSSLDQRLYLSVRAQRQRLGQIRRYLLVRNQAECCTLSKGSDQQLPLHH